MTENAKPDTSQDAKDAGSETDSVTNKPQIANLLQKISARIAEAEANEEEASGAVRERLEALRDQTSSARDLAQSDARGTFASVEAALEKLSQQVNDQTEEGLDRAWDNEAAEALTSHCEDAGLAKSDQKQDLLLGDDQAAAATAGTDAPGYVYLQPDANEIGQKWFEDRFEDLARRFDDATGDAAGGGYSSVMEKLDTLEAQLGTLLGQPDEDGATGGGALQDIELCIAEIANQLEATSLELKRIEKIEEQISELSNMITEKSGMQIGDGDNGNANAQMIADLVAARVQAQPLGLAAAGGLGGSEGEGVAELSATLKSFINERRNEGEHANAVLDTMQQTIIRLLDRMEALERKGPRAGSGTGDAAAGQMGAQGAAAAPARSDAHEPRGHALQAPSLGIPGDVAAAAPTLSGPGQANRQEPPATRPARKVHATIGQAASGQAGAQSEEAVSLDRLKRAVGQLDAGESETAGGEATNQAPRNRADFIAAARRAAAKAGGHEEAVTEGVQSERAKFAEAARRAVSAGGHGINDDTDDAEIDATHDGFSLGSIAARLRPKSKAKTKAKAKNTDPVRTLVAIAVLVAVGLGASKLTMMLTSDAARQELLSNNTQQGSSVAGENGAAAIPRPQANLAQPNSLAGDAGQGNAQADNVQPGSVAYGGDNTNLDGLVQPAAVNHGDGAAANANEPLSGGAGGVAQKELPSMLIGPLSLRLAAANGDASAEFQVAARYADGSGVPQDFKEAVKWYGRSASRGFALAQYRLGTLHERGLGVTKDIDRARIWYERAAAGDNIKAMHNLAVLAASPQSGKPDYRTAAAWFIKAAERGLADSQFNLAILYQNGLGVPLDDAAAYKWFSLAAKAGDAEAVKRMAEMASKLGKQRVAAIDSQTENWRAKATNRLANDPHHAGQAWQRSSS